MNIVIIDDDRLVALSLKTILENSGVVSILAVGHSGSDAIKLYREYLPDIMLMDIRMEGMSGLEAGEQLLSEFPDARILYLTTFADDEYIVRALRIGARGYILKQDFEGLTTALDSIMNGQSVFGSELMVKLPDLLNDNATSASPFNYASHDISEREQEVIRYVAEGLSNKEIAAAMFLSDGTIRNYISNILDKLELRDRTQLAVFYYTKVRKQTTI